MARAAVRAKQAERASAAAAAKPRRKRGHASGGNPSQDLFFSRIRRRLRWVLIVLAALFAISYAALGVGSGTGGGLEQIWNSILGSSNDPVGQAQAEIKTNPAQGYRDLASAYLTKGDVTSAIGAMNSYLAIKKHDSGMWTQLANYDQSQAKTYTQQYQQVLQAAAIQSPGSILAPQAGTPLANALGTNPIDQAYQQQNSLLEGPLYQKASDAYTASMTAFESAAKYAPTKALKAAAWYSVYTEAAYAGNQKEGLVALQNYVQLNPTATGLKQIEATCKSLGGSCVPKTHKTK